MFKLLKYFEALVKAVSISIPKLCHFCITQHSIRKKEPHYLLTTNLGNCIIDTEAKGFKLAGVLMALVFSVLSEARALPGPEGR